MRTNTRNFYERAVLRTVLTITRGLDNALDLDALASEAAMSSFHFHRMFRGLIGETPLEMHRRLRLERAAWQLLRTDALITEIAFAAGYETHESFTRAFGSCYACSPSAFRASRNPDGTHYSAFRIQLANRSGVHFPDLSAQLDEVFSRAIRSATGVSMQVEIRQLPAQRLATIEHRGPYNRIAEAFARLGQIAGPAGLFGPQAAMIALYLDDPESTPASELRAEAALVVSADKVLPTTVGENLLPAGSYACTVHEGGYDRLGDTWARFMGQWLPQSGHRLSDSPSFERYLNTPMDVPVDQLRTELYLPLV